MENRVLKSLSYCPLFAGMSEKEIDEVMLKIKSHILFKTKGEVYALEGETCRNVDLIIAGTLTARMTSFSGKFVEVTQLHEGNVVAPAFVFAKQNRFPVSVDVETDVEVLRMIPDEFKRLIDSNERVRWNFIVMLSNINHFLTSKVRMFSLLSAREMIASLLQEMSIRHESNTFILEKSRQEIADSLGLQKLSVIRAFNALKEEGAIAIDGKKITILEPRKLN